MMMVVMKTTAFSRKKKELTKRDENGMAAVGVFHYGTVAKHDGCLIV